MKPYLSMAISHLLHYLSIKIKWNTFEVKHMEESLFSINVCLFTWKEPVLQDVPPILRAVFSSLILTGCGNLFETMRADRTLINFRAEPSRLTSKTTRTAGGESDDCAPDVGRAKALRKYVPTLSTDTGDISKGRRTNLNRNCVKIYVSQENFNSRSS